MFFTWRFQAGASSDSCKTHYACTIGPPISSVFSKHHDEIHETSLVVVLLMLSINTARSKHWGRHWFLDIIDSNRKVCFELKRILGYNMITHFQCFKPCCCLGDIGDSPSPYFNFRMLVGTKSTSIASFHFSSIKHFQEIASNKNPTILSPKTPQPKHLIFWKYTCTFQQILYQLIVYDTILNISTLQLRKNITSPSCQGPEKGRNIIDFKPNGVGIWWAP